MKADIICMADILRPILGSLKRSNTCRTPVVLNVLDNPPNGKLDKYGNVTDAFEIIHFIEILFMMTTSRAIHFDTAEMLNIAIKSRIIKSLQQIIYTYHSRGFRIRHTLGDQQFECIRKTMELQGINMNITGRDKHFPEAGKLIWTVKKRTRATMNTLPSKYYPTKELSKYYKHCILAEFLPTQGRHTQLLGFFLKG